MRIPPFWWHNSSNAHSQAYSSNTLERSSKLKGPTVLDQQIKRQTLYKITLARLDQQECKGCGDGALSGKISEAGLPWLWTSQLKFIFVERQGPNLQSEPTSSILPRLHHFHRPASIRRKQYNRSDFGDEKTRIFLSHCSSRQGTRKLLWVTQYGQH